MRRSTAQMAGVMVALFVAAACSSQAIGTSVPTSTMAGPGGSDAPPDTVDAPVGTTEPNPAPTTVAVAVPTFVDANGFDDHTVPNVASVAELMALARPGVNGQSVLKFAIPNLNSGPVHLTDSNFYSLHDEWYWFRLLNGQAVPGTTTQPVRGRTFATVAEIYAWADSIDPVDLPLDLQWTSGQRSERRLYSNEFYNIVLNRAPRAFGAGSLIRQPSRTPGVGDHWLIELEYSDKRNPAQIAQFFERLVPALPDEVAWQLKWVIRSPEQEAVAVDMEAKRLPYHDRIVRYSELVPPGETAIYSEGVTAGRLLFVGEGGKQLGDAVATDIIVVDNVPDWLPPASALISSAPQTALAHVNLLARNRGIPNASRSGITDDPTIRQAARVRAPAIVRASGDQLDILLITEAQYQQWQQRTTKAPIAVPPVDVATMPLILDIQTLADSVRTESDLDKLRPTIGGKSAGLITLLRTDGLNTPPDPTAITVKPYLAHLGLVQVELAAMLGDFEFQNSPRARFLFLEGPEDYAKLFASLDDESYAAELADRYPAGSPLAEILAAGGFKRLFRSVPMDGGTVDELEAALGRQYGGYSPTEGLRFRSSSSIEDIEGFNGAGLYDSNTGYLDPAVQEDEDDWDRSVEWAIKKTWSSYWGFEAFEERRLENIDHLSGAMGVTVHARSDDDFELDNGVATFTVLSASSPNSGELLVNVQPGSTSVANPDTGELALPEATSVVRRDDGSLQITRVAKSSIADGAEVLSDPELAEMFEQFENAAAVWMRRINSELVSEQRWTTAVLDFEFKHVKAGWPMLKPGSQPYPARLVIKQVRSLDPGLRAIPVDVRDLPVPRDVLSHARRVEWERCPAIGGVKATSIVRVFTRSLSEPDLGYSVQPFTAVVPAGEEPLSRCTTTVLFSTPDQYLIDLLYLAGVPG